MEWNRSFVNAQFQSYGADLPWIPESGSIDESIVSQVTGTKVKFDRQGMIEMDLPEKQQEPLSEKDMDDFQTYRDLFWLYVKLDTIQSLIRGTRVL